MSQKSSNLQEFKANLQLSIGRHDNHLFYFHSGNNVLQVFQKDFDFLKQAVSFFPYVTKSNRGTFLFRLNHALRDTLTRKKGHATGI